MSKITERELKFFVPATKLRQQVTFSKLKRLLLWQAYFSDDNTKEAFKLVFGNKTATPKLLTGRLRRSKISKSYKYTATFKGPYLSECSRTEYEKKITAKLYKNLKPLCSGFEVHKARYLLPGSIIHRGKKYRITAEIDHLLKWTNEFFTVDLEVPKDAWIASLRKGQHSFEFLKSGSIDLTTAPPEIRKVLSMKYLARNGFNQKARNAAAKLTSEVK